MTKLSTALIAGLIAATCGGASADDYYSNSGSNTSSSQAPLTASNGMTLYIFDRDSAGTSNCYGDCAESWPPFTAAAGAASPSAAYSKIQRNDGTLQWAKDGAPLYFWVGDTRPGDTNGDGVGGVWHVAH